MQAIAVARRVRATFILGSAIAFITTALYAQGLSAPERSPTSGNGPASLAPTTVKSQTAAVHPLWSELTPQQQQALAPLAQEWDKLDSFRKNKWLAIGNKFASMKPEEQQRVHVRMRDWVKLTPEQRRIARESYARAKKLPPEQKSEQWQRYQELPEEQRKKLAADAASKKHVATLPSASQQGKGKTVPPIKSAPKPILEKSVTPAATQHSALQPAPLPEKK
jgi:hypothetical protein